MNGYTLNAARYAALLTRDIALDERSVVLQLADWTLRIRSNSTALLERLARYFAHVRVTGTAVDMDVIAIECEPPVLDVEFVDWRREPGKQGRKDSYVDLADGRLVRKVRTGMVFVQSETWRIAAGACLQHDNQVINFVNAQFMNRLQQSDWRICHASALVRNGAALAIAGLSGGGKSTLMLRMLDLADVAYLTNDRLFVRWTAQTVMAVGIPKLPRINPGTIVHNERLHGLIADDARAACLAMPADELWQLEQKHDVFIDEVYGTGRIAPRAPLGGFVVLNWRRADTQALRVEQVDLAGRDDLLAAIMKSPGPFYQYADGRMYADGTPFDRQAYLDALTGVPVYEVCGNIDFEAIRGQLERLTEWRDA